MEIVEEPKTCGTQHEDEEKIDLSISSMLSKTTRLFYQLTTQNGQRTHQKHEKCIHT